LIGFVDVECPHDAIALKAAKQLEQSRFEIIRRWTVLAAIASVNRCGRDYRSFAFSM